MIKIVIENTPEMRSLLRDLDGYLNDDLIPSYEDQLRDAILPGPVGAAKIRATALLSAAIFDGLDGVGNVFK